MSWAYATEADREGVVMSMIKTPALVFVVVLLVAAAGFVGSFVRGVIGPTDAKPSAPHLAERTNQLPTATEVFNLRSKCAALGEKMLENDFVGSALTHSQVSLYNPRTNRCYVELTAQTANVNIPITYLRTALFDGQTGEMLAYFKLEKGVSSGMVYDRQHQTTKTLDADGYDDAQAYIDKLMQENREQ